MDSSGAPDSNAGVFTLTNTTSRQIQFALKLTVKKIRVRGQPGFSKWDCPRRAASILRILLAQTEKLAAKVLLNFSRKLQGHAVFIRL